MFPHQNNIRDRRVGQPPMAPQHLMGMPQQGPGMKIEVLALLGLLILIQSIEGKVLNIEGITAQEFALMFGRNGCIQGVIMPIQPLSQIMAPVYNHNQGICTKPSLRNFDPTGHQRGTFYHNDYVNSTNSLRYYNGHYSAPINRGGQKTNVNSHEGVHTSKKQIKESVNTNNVENRQECAAIPSHYKKEKTPMCLVNELARFNKITHQYRLTNEKGPPHKKSFTVTLALGEEEYTAEGPSIKKAQHAAAAEALAKTSLSRPVPKSFRNNLNGRGNLTPTVELNALAMKRGQLAVYTLIESAHTQQGFREYQKKGNGLRGFNRRGRNGYFSRNYRGPVKSYTHQTNYTVSLKVGDWEFVGEGTTPQMARHDAASKALKELRALPEPDEKTCPANNNNTEEPNQAPEPARKSPVSLVFEIALKRNLDVMFEVISEEGPPHMKTFVTRCTIGSLTTVGEGNGKKVSKKKAAEKMLVELEKLPSISPSHSGNVMNVHKMKRKMSQKRKSRNLIKVVKESSLESDTNEETNPVLRLLQLQQATKEKEPVFTVIEEKDKKRGKDFVIEVSFASHTATGTGLSKKLAKRAAAQNLLTQMGYPDLDKTKSKFDSQNSKSMANDRKVNFVDGGKSQENKTGGSYGRQLKPGIYVMSSDQQGSPPSETFNMQMTATIARELLNSGNSPTADALVEQSTASKTTLTGQESIRPKDQLLSIADLLNFQVHFSDFPKGNHSEFLSLVTMSTDPSHVCHGSGASVEESQDQAALTALRALSEMGLDQTAAQELNQSGKVLAAINK